MDAQPLLDEQAQEKRNQAAVELGISTIHLCPPEGKGLFPCCGKTPFEVPGYDRVTLSKRSVTCGRP
jgi:hypothetical protein